MVFNWRVIFDSRGTFGNATRHSWLSQPEGILLLGLAGLARDAAKHHTLHRTASYNKELSDPKCQWC